MKLSISSPLVSALVLLLPCVHVGAQTPVGTAFTYQGRLEQSGQPASGNFDFSFELWDVDSGGTTPLSTQTSTNVPVTDGLFTITLDFGSNVFQGDARWLDIGVKIAGGPSYTSLPPRQMITPTPFAIDTQKIAGQTVSSMMPEAEDFLAWTGSDWAPTPGGDVTGVAAGNGLTGGGTSGDVTLGIGQGTGIIVGADTVSVDLSALAGTGLGVDGQGLRVNIGPGLTNVGDAVAFPETPTFSTGAAQCSYVLQVLNETITPCFSGAVLGWNVGSSGDARGVSGWTASSSGKGIDGIASATSGVNYAVYGRTSSPSGWGTYSVGASGSTGQKSFIQPHPKDATKEIRFVCLEGNESGTYFRGSSKLVDGQAVIDVPEEFRLVSEANGVTVQVTALGPNSGLWVESKNLEQIVVRGEQDVEFDYFVNGVRRGFADIQLVHENHAYKPEVRGLPFGTQYPAALRRILIENGTLNPDFTPNDTTALRLGWTLRDPTPEEIERGAASPLLPKSDPLEVTQSASPAETNGRIQKGDSQ